MASPVTHALNEAMYTGSSQKLYYWAFRHPNPDAPPHTFRLTRREKNGWLQLLVASKETGAVLAFHADTPEDQAAVKDALKWFGIHGEIESAGGATILKLANGSELVSAVWGGEKKKAK